MADQQYKRKPEEALLDLSDDDPMAELARLVGFDTAPVPATPVQAPAVAADLPKMPASKAEGDAGSAAPLIDLEAELLREFDAYDAGERSRQDEAALRDAAPALIPAAEPVPPTVAASDDQEAEAEVDVESLLEAELFRDDDASVDEPGPLDLSNADRGAPAAARSTPDVEEDEVIEPAAADDLEAWMDATVVDDAAADTVATPSADPVAFDPHDVARADGQTGSGHAEAVGWDADEVPVLADAAEHHVGLQADATEGGGERSVPDGWEGRSDEGPAGEDQPSAITWDAVPVDDATVWADDRLDAAFAHEDGAAPASEDAPQPAAEDFPDLDLDELLEWEPEAVAEGEAEPERVRSSDDAAPAEPFGSVRVDEPAAPVFGQPVAAEAAADDQGERVDDELIDEVFAFSPQPQRELQPLPDFNWNASDSVVFDAASYFATDGDAVSNALPAGLAGEGAVSTTDRPERRPFWVRSNPIAAPGSAYALGQQGNRPPLDATTDATAAVGSDAAWSWDADEVGADPIRPSHADDDSAFAEASSVLEPFAAAADDGSEPAFETAIADESVDALDAELPEIELDGDWWRDLEKDLDDDLRAEAEAESDSYSGVTKAEAGSSSWAAAATVPFVAEEPEMAPSTWDESARETAAPDGAPAASEPEGFSFDVDAFAEPEEPVEAMDELDVPRLPDQYLPSEPIAQEALDQAMEAEFADLIGETPFDPSPVEEPAAGGIDRAAQLAATGAAAAIVTAGAATAQQAGAWRAGSKMIDDAGSFDDGAYELGVEDLAEETLPAAPVERRVELADRPPAGRPAEVSEEPEGFGGRRMIAAAIVGVVLVGGVGAYTWSLLAGDTGGDGGPRVIAANKDPIKVQPEDPGGKSVPNQNKAVYDRVEGDLPAVPQQKELLTTTEEPVDVVQRTLDPNLLPLDERPVEAPPSAGADGAPADGATKGEDRLTAEAGNPTAAAADDAPKTLVQPRKVRTMVVRADGTLEARDDPAPAPAAAAETAPAAPAASSPSSGSAATAPDADSMPAQPAETAGLAPSNDARPSIQASAPAASDSAPAPDAVAAPDAAAATVANAPVPAPRPAAPAASTASAEPPAAAAPAPARPVETAARETAPAATPPAASASAAPQASASAAPGGYVIQIASQPTEAGAQASYRNLSSRYASVLGGRAVDIRKAEIPNKGVYYRVRIVASSREDALDLCTRYKAAGGSCFVTR